MVKVLTKLLLTLTVILFANQSFAEKIPTLTLKEIQDLEGQSDTETIEGFTLKDLEEPRSSYYFSDLYINTKKRELFTSFY